MFTKGSQTKLSGTVQSGLDLVTLDVFFSLSDSRILCAGFRWLEYIFLKTGNKWKGSLGISRRNTDTTMIKQENQYYFPLTVPILILFFKQDIWFAKNFFRTLKKFPYFSEFGHSLILLFLLCVCFSLTLEALWGDPILRCIQCLLQFGFQSLTKHFRPSQKQHLNQIIQVTSPSIQKINCRVRKNLWKFWCWCHSLKISTAFSV